MMSLIKNCLIRRKPASQKMPAGIAEKIALLLIISVLVAFPTDESKSQSLKVNDLEYFEKQAVNIIVFSNEYHRIFFDEKISGIELIHHGVRTATGGAVRLHNTPEQWDLIPVLVDRKVNTVDNSIEFHLRYEEFDFDSRVNVIAHENGVKIEVYLDAPIPEILVGKAGFNLEFLPSAYFEKMFLADGKPGIFPLYPSGPTVVKPVSDKLPQWGGHNTFDDRGRGEYIVPKPIASGRTFILAPEDPKRTVKLVSPEQDILMFDGRNLAQNGWFVFRTMLPENKTGKVLTWHLEPNAIPGWIRKPNIGVSQVGYHPMQEKVAVIELDKNDTPLQKATLMKVAPDGIPTEVYTTALSEWGHYLRYNYLTFDFSTVKATGIYFIKYGDHTTNTFIIAEDVYEKVWHPTLDVFFPVQMDHMTVNEAYRTWHGIPFLDDALQAPVNHQHFDGYRMDSVTDTRFKPFERIPGLAVGGWFDAGDYDIQTGTHCTTILHLVAASEHFDIGRDQTLVDKETRYVDIHRPDGIPDILQQIEHGILNLVAQVENIGHPVRGIVVPNLHQYHHLGDASTSTDNLPYNPNLKPYETDGKSSGTMDDRWVFTNRNPSLDFTTASALAAAGRTMRGYNDELAGKCFQFAGKLFTEAAELARGSNMQARMFRGRNSEINAALQLFIATKEPMYKQRFEELIWPALEQNLGSNISTALQAAPHMGSDYKSKLRAYVVQYKETIDNPAEPTPYGVPISRGGWGGNMGIINWAITNYFAHNAFPDIVGPEYVFKGLNYIFGCHPYSNISFVSAVGAQSKKVAYGSNRADFSFIAGGVTPGIVILKPDFPENKEDWPFLWGQNEYIVDIGAAYIFLANAVNDLLSRK